MVDWSLVATGVGIGIAVSAPVGPVNVMCIHRALRAGFLPGLSAGLGAVAGDGVYAAIAAFGITAISGFIEGNLDAIQLVGGIVLILFGLRIALKPPLPRTEVADDTALSLAGAAATAFALTVTNPALIVGFVAIFGGLGEIADEPLDYASAGLLVASVMGGGLLWFSALSALVSRFRARIDGRWLRAINFGSGLALAAFGVAVLASLALGQAG